MLFKVLRDCHYKNRYWTADEIASFPEGETPNEHFEAVGDNVSQPVVEVLPEPMTMSEMNEARKLIQPKTGMGYTEEMQKEAKKKRAVEVEVPEKRKPGRPKAKA